MSFSTLFKSFTLFLILLLSACSTAPVPFETLRDQLGKAPLRHVHVTEQFQFTLDYMPSWSYVMDELEAMRENATVETSAVADLVRGHQDVVQFVLSIGPRPGLPEAQRKSADIVHHHPDRSSYSAHLNKLMYGMSEHIYLVTADKRKVPVGLYHLDRNWGMGETNRFLLQFPRGRDGDDLARQKTLELVLQHLHPELVEVRLQLDPNPMIGVEPAPEGLAASLAAAPPQP